MSKIDFNVDNHKAQNGGAICPPALLVELTGILIERDMLDEANAYMREVMSRNMAYEKRMARYGLEGELLVGHVMIPAGKYFRFIETLPGTPAKFRF